MELQISRAIVDTFYKKLQDNLSIDVAVVGGGPSGMVAATYLARKGYKVALFEKKLAPGGGMWGGAMLFNQIVIQQDAVHILQDFGIDYEKYEEGLYTADSVQATAALLYNATKAGVTVFNGVVIEDVVFHNDAISGVVINWTPVQLTGMHVDPLVIMSRTVLDATGHDADVVNVVAKKNDIKLNTPSGKIMGERSMNVEVGEPTTVENTKEVFPGLFVSGMAANGVSGSFRMGPIFGGMLLSGEKVANLIAEKLAK